jgi:hypothetical protein
MVWRDDRDPTILSKVDGKLEDSVRKDGKVSIPARICRSIEGGLIMVNLWSHWLGYDTAGPAGDEQLGKVVNIVCIGIKARTIDVVTLAMALRRACGLVRATQRGPGGADQSCRNFMPSASSGAKSAFGTLVEKHNRHYSPPNKITDTEKERYARQIVEKMVLRTICY